MTRHGKFIDISAQGLHLVFHLARAGWLRWKDDAAGRAGPAGQGPARAPGPAGRRLRASTSPRPAPSASWRCYVVADPQDIPMVATLGPDPLTDDFDRAALAALLTKAGRAQLKGVLKDQRTIAGIGNAYSDEILHAAKLSPFKPASSLTDDELSTLYARDQGRADRRDRSGPRGWPPRTSRARRSPGCGCTAARARPCAVCGDTIAEVSFADSSLQYCPTCQTGGKKLADRRLSKLLK